MKYSNLTSHKSQKSNFCWFSLKFSLKFSLTVGEIQREIQAPDLWRDLAPLHCHAQLAAQPRAAAGRGFGDDLSDGMPSRWPGCTVGDVSPWFFSEMGHPKVFSCLTATKLSKLGISRIESSLFIDFPLDSEWFQGEPTPKLDSNSHLLSEKF